MTKDSSQPHAESSAAAGVVPSTRLASVDVLRGLAVLAVVITHLPFSTALSAVADAGGSHSALPPSVTQWTSYGMYGVHLFLVLSGFCIHLRWVRTGRDDASIDFVPFWKRRLHRLYPPYFVALIATLAALFVFHGVLHHTWRSGIAAAVGYSSLGALGLDLVLLLLLMQNINGAADRVGNAPFWSLALEEQLYMLYFPLLYLRKRFGWAVTFAVTLATSLTWRLLLPLFPWKSTIHWTLLGPSRWFEWMLGALAVEAHFGRVQVPRWVRSPLHIVAAGALAIASDPPHHWAGVSHASIFADLAFGWFFFSLTHAVTMSARAENLVRNTALFRVLVSVGVASYSIYLTHEPVLVVAKWIGLKARLNVPLVLGLRFALAIAIGYAFHYLVERRFIDASRPSKKAAPPECVAVSP